MTLKNYCAALACIALSACGGQFGSDIGGVNLLPRKGGNEASKATLVNGDWGISKLTCKDVDASFSPTDLIKIGTAQIGYVQVTKEDADQRCFTMVVSSRVVRSGRTAQDGTYAEDFTSRPLVSQYRCYRKQNGGLAKQPHEAKDENLNGESVDGSLSVKGTQMTLQLLDTVDCSDGMLVFTLTK